MKGYKLLLTLVFICGAVWACSQRPSKKLVVFALPDDFQGIFWVIPSDDSFKNKNIPLPEQIEIHVPDSGIASSAQFRIFEEWHLEKVSLPRDSGNKRFLMSLGREDDKMIFYYGDEATFDAHVKKKSPSVLRPGRIR